MADKAGDTFRDKKNKLHVLVEGKHGRLRPVTVAGNPKVGDGKKNPPKK